VFQIRESTFSEVRIAGSGCPEKNLKLCSVNLGRYTCWVIESYAAEDDFGLQRVSCPPCAVRV